MLLSRPCLADVAGRFGVILLGHFVDNETKRRARMMTIRQEVQNACPNVRNYFEIVSFLISRMHDHREVQ